MTFFVHLQNVQFRFLQYVNDCDEISMNTIYSTTGRGQLYMLKMSLADAFILVEYVQ